MKESRNIAFGGMLAALSVVILLLGASSGIGTYAAPMMAAPLLAPVGRKMGRRWHILLWLTVSLLGFLLIVDLEQNLMYLCLFGPYPILRPWFESRNQPQRTLFKLLWFNAVTAALEWAVMTLLIPEVSSLWMNLLLLGLGNVVFFFYDRIIPRLEGMILHYLGRALKL
ncbi:MAG: hypothetical protein IJD21_09920 [Oscillospiraceae bacterium]|nr:hypothetical protein [Oscillospiraceae bacterium]